MTTLPETTLVEFIRYNNWSNQQVLAACRDLDESQLAAAIPGAYGTIRQTLEHIIRAEASYLRLLTGSRPEPSFDWKAGPGVEVVRGIRRADFSLQHAVCVRVRELRVWARFRTLGICLRNLAARPFMGGAACRAYGVHRAAFRRPHVCVGNLRLCCRPA